MVIRQNGRNIGFEFKLTRSPKVTPSMRSAREVLGLDRLYVVCHGAGEPWSLAEGIVALPALCLASSDWLPWTPRLWQGVTIPRRNLARWLLGVWTCNLFGGCQGRGDLAARERMEGYLQSSACQPVFAIL